MARKRQEPVERLLRTELVELKGLRKDMKLIMRRLDTLNETLAPVSQKAKQDLESEELEEAILRGVDPEAYEGLLELGKMVRRGYRAHVKSAPKK